MIAEAGLGTINAGLVAGVGAGRTPGASRTSGARRGGIVARQRARVCGGDRFAATAHVLRQRGRAIPGAGGQGSASSVDCTSVATCIGGGAFCSNFIPNAADYSNTAECTSDTSRCRSRRAAGSFQLERQPTFSRKHRDRRCRQCHAQRPTAHHGTHRQRRSPAERTDLAPGQRPGLAGGAECGR